MNSVNQMVNDLQNRLNAKDTTNLLKKNKQKGKVVFPWSILFIVLLSIGVGALISINYMSLFDGGERAPSEQQSKSHSKNQSSLKEIVIDVVPNEKKINFEKKIASKSPATAEKKIIKEKIFISDVEVSEPVSMAKVKRSVVKEVKPVVRAAKPKQVAKINVESPSISPEKKSKKVVQEKITPVEVAIKKEKVVKPNVLVKAKKSEKVQGEVKVVKVERVNPIINPEVQVRVKRKLPSNDAFNKIEIPFSNVELAETMFQRGAILLNQGEFGRASLLFEKALKEYPAYLKATEALVSIHTNNGDWAKAENILKLGINAERKNISLTMLLAQIYLQLERVPDALTVLKNNLVYAKGNGEYFALLAVIYQNQEEYVLALDAYQKALKTDGSSSRWWFGMAVVLELQNNMPDAQLAYNQALQIGQLPEDLISYAEQRLEYVVSQIELSAVP